MSSALEDVSVRSSTSSVTNLSIEILFVVWISSFGSYTLTISKVFTDDLCSMVVIPEVVGGDWSPDTTG
jgi:hypothetical protein